MKRIKLIYIAGLNLGIIVKVMMGKSKRNIRLGGSMIVLTGLMSACTSTPRLPFTGDAQSTTQAPATASPLSNVETLEGDNANNNTQNKVQTLAPVAPASLFIRSDLLGLSSLQLDQLLGPPALVNNSGGDGQLRRYDNASCNLVILMRRDASGRLVSDSMRASQKNSSEQRPLLQDCLNGF